MRCALRQLWLWFLDGRAVRRADRLFKVLSNDSQADVNLMRALLAWAQERIGEIERDHERNRPR